MTAGFVLALALAALIGISLGLLGSGGSIITLPVLVYVAGVPEKHAVGMSLVIVGATSAFGGFQRARRGEFAWRAGLLFAGSGMIGSFLGAQLTHFASARLLMVLFACLMLVAGVAMLRPGPQMTGGRACHAGRCLGAGAAVGVLTGFLGVGGGMMILPALVLLAGVEMKKAVGTSLAIIALNSFAGLLGQLLHVSFDWLQAGAFLAIALLGMWGGLALADRFSSQALRRTFGLVILMLGLALLVQNLVVQGISPQR